MKPFTGMSSLNVLLCLCILFSGLQSHPESCTRLRYPDQYVIYCSHLKGKYHENLLSFQNPKMFDC